MWIGSWVAWVASASGLVGTIINCHWRNRICFLFWLASNIAWLVVGLHDRAWPLVAQYVVYTCLSIDGWFRWRKLDGGE